MTDIMPVLHVEKPPITSPQDWTLQVDGLVEKPRIFTMKEFFELKATEYIGPFVCVTGWDREHLKWKGVRLSDLIEAVRPTDESSYVIFHAPSGYTDSLTMNQAIDDRVLLAYELEGNPLPKEHGGPLRLVVPFLLAYKSVKWVNRVEFTKKEHLGYWEQRGYPVEAEIPPAKKKRLGL